MRRQTTVILITCILVMTFSSPLVPVEAQHPSDVSVLMLIGSGFGLNYYDARERLESWGANVTTVAYHTGYEVPSCPNRDSQPVTADLLLSEVDNHTLLQFDCFFVPSGGHWQGLIQSQQVLDAIEIAYDLGLSIAVICTGSRVLAHANNIVNGSSVGAFFLSYSLMEIEGARVRHGPGVVVDNRLITGGAGGGVGEGGWMDAPTSEVCAEVLKQALGLSYVTGASVVPASGVPGTSFTVSVAVTDLEESLGSYVTTNISTVVASVYWKHNRTLIEEVELAFNEGTERYDGSFILEENAEFLVDIEVEDSNGTLEIAGDLAELTISSSPVLLYAAAGVGIGILALVVVLVRRRRGS